MKIRTSCLLLGACLLAGCWQKSLHPFYQAGDVVFDGNLLGSWREASNTGAAEEQKGQIWTFEDGVNNAYKLEITDQNETNNYSANLFELDGVRLLDIVPTQRTISTIPAHNLFKVAAAPGSLQLSALNVDWVQKWLRTNTAPLAYFAVVNPESPDNREKDELVLTADTKALQDFLRAQVNNTELFTEPESFKPHNPR